MNCNSPSEEKGKALNLFSRFQVQLNTTSPSQTPSKTNLNSHKILNIQPKDGNLHFSELFKQKLLNIRSDKEKHTKTEVQLERHETEIMQSGAEQLLEGDTSAFNQMYRKTLLETIAQKAGQDLQSLDDQLVKFQQQRFKQEEQEYFSNDKEQRYKKAARHIMDIIYSRKSVHEVNTETKIEKYIVFRSIHSEKISQTFDALCT